MKSVTVCFILAFIFASNIYSQEKWVPVYDTNGQKLYIDVDGLNIYRGDEFYIWTLETHDPLLTIESVKAKIYKTKTYYHINKKLNKYNLVEIIYYDKNNNVLANFNYKDIPKIKNNSFNYPILPGSQLELVSKTCEKYLGKR